MRPATPVPPRLHVLMAAAADTAVVFRRGPANAVCSILWNRGTDTFQTGQWLRARIYERRSDLSPDGRYLIYFAGNSRWSSRTRGSWTAVSRAPYLKAVALYGKGDCWNGGGLFTSGRSYWLNDGCGHFLLEDSGEVQRDQCYRPPAHYGGECPGVYYLRLQRDGWLLKDRLTAGASAEFTVFEKPLPDGWILRKYAHSEVNPPRGKGCHWDEHELEHPHPHRRTQFPDWEWADRDGDTVVWATGGCLHRAPIDSRGLSESRLLFDFRKLQFQAIEAPY